MVLFGLPENLKIAEYVYHYLHETGNRLWQKNRSARGYTRRDRISFDIGFTQGIKKTLAASELPGHAGPERTKALIAVNSALTSSMDKIIRAEAGRVFPKTIRRSSRYRHSESAFHQGYEEGRNTHIKKGIHQKGENTLRYLA